MAVFVLLVDDENNVVQVTKRDPAGWVEHLKLAKPFVDVAAQILRRKPDSGFKHQTEQSLYTDLILASGKLSDDEKRNAVDLLLSRSRFSIVNVQDAIAAPSIPVIGSIEGFQGDNSAGPYRVLIYYIDP